MERKVFEQYPDYLKDFEDVKIYEYCQWRVFNRITNSSNDFLRELWDNGNNVSWWTYVRDTAGLVYGYDTIIKLHGKYELTTLDVIDKYMSCWMKEGAFQTEYDIDTMTIKVKAESSVFKDKHYKYIRDLIPCNMLLVNEIAESLD